MITWYADEIVTIQFSRMPRTETLNATPNSTPEEIKDINKKPYLLLHEIEVTVKYGDKTYIFPVEKHYRWNGANIPFGLWNLIGSPSDNRVRIPSMIHDKLCENHDFIGYDRYLSSIIFERLLRVAGVNKIKRRVMFLAVDNFQKFCGWDKEKKQQEGK